MTEPTAGPVRAARGVRGALVVGARVVSGTAGLAIAAFVIAFVGLAPIPSIGIAAPAVEVTPEAADQVRVCPGGVLRLGEESGADAGTPLPIDEATVVAAASGATLDSTPLGASDAGTGGSSAAPRVLRIPPGGDDAILAGAQFQRVDARDFVGTTAAACAEPGSSLWLVAGALTVGRSAILTLSNPTTVAASVDLTIFGESGPVVAPGLSGIDVPAGAQRVLALAGFAPGVAAPVVHVEARGGQVVAAIQHSVVRGLAATGVEITGPTADPATDLVIPGVRILDAVGTNRALALDDWSDVAPVIRVLAPGTDDAQVEVSVVPDDPSVAGTSFRLDAPAGIATEVPLDAAESDQGLVLPDGGYTVTLHSDVPVVAAVRISTAVDSGSEPAPDAVLAAPPSDLAWFVAVPELTGDALVAIADGPEPVLSAHNPTSADVVLTLDALEGPDVEVRIAAGASASTPVVPGVVYRLTGARGLVVAVSYAAPGEIAAVSVWPSRPVAGPIVIRPN